MQKCVIIVSVDHYLTRPSMFDDNFSNFRQCEVEKVPVLRVFGATENDEKICVHIHKVYPYVFVPYHEVNDGPVEDFQKLLANEIDKALNDTFKLPDKTQHIYEINRVFKKSFYGYNDESDFLKISFYNPFMVRKACQLLLNGVVIDKKNIQPYESHINYVLQFMMDYNLFGMSHLRISEFVPRRSAQQLDRNSMRKSTICLHEIDICSASILNVQDVTCELGIGVNPGFREIWMEEKIRRNQSLDLSRQLTDNRCMVFTKSHLYFEKIMLDKLTTISQTNYNLCQNEISILNEIQTEETDNSSDDAFDADSILSQVNKMVVGDEINPATDDDFEDGDDNVMNFSLCLDENGIDFDFDLTPNLPQLDGADDFDESILDFSIAKSESEVVTSDINDELLDDNWVQIQTAKNDTFITLDWLPPTRDDLSKLQCCSQTKCDNKLSPILKLNYSLPRLSANSPTSSKSNQGGNYSNLKVVIVEIHANSRHNLVPDSDFDEIVALFYTILDKSKPYNSGIISVDDVIVTNDDHCVKATDEKHLITLLVDLLEYYDPDILIGYETESMSWGYIMRRGFKLGLNMAESLSRVRYYTPNRNKQFKTSVDSNFQPIGRILLNLWRILRHELTLQSYTFENVIYHVLNSRISKLSFELLTNFWRSDRNRINTVQYYKIRVKGVAEILSSLDFVARTCELARLFGIQFYEVLSRGSQFRVESIMLRLAKPKGFVAISPNFIQRRDMNAPEYLPLILEPESNFYSDPVLVLDFQSLYPSMIIAYNYCFSTCLGRVDCLNSESQTFKFGTSVHRMDASLVRELMKNQQLLYSPCGVAFVSKDVRHGILPQMLHDILDARLLVKKSMKLNEDDPDLQKVFHSRQLGLKLIANVTYGYTSANFSGRMPLVELGDSIVSKGRETLERAIEMVQKSAKWNAKVIYGDTDSLFVLLAGRTKAEAFAIGEEIAQQVTESNPSPVKLKFEKVYMPCFLQTKKRYVGFMYESVDQKEPIYDAKGIETVRRDTCPIVSQLLKKSIQIYSKYQNATILKKYLCGQFQNVLSNRFGVEAFIFAKEFRGFSGYSARACVPSLELARKMFKIDKNIVPKHGERVPYVVVYGPPKVPLIKLVRSPIDFIRDPALKLNHFYYITKCIIPSLNRCFSLIKIDIFDWFKEMPKSYYKKQSIVANSGRKATISQYFVSKSCSICRKDSSSSEFCLNCLSNKQSSYLSLQGDKKEALSTLCAIREICRNCTNNHQIDPSCKSIDCPIFFQIEKFQRNYDEALNLFDKLEF